MWMRFAEKNAGIIFIYANNARRCRRRQRPGKTRSERGGRPVSPFERPININEALIQNDGRRFIACTSIITISIVVIINIATFSLSLSLARRSELQTATTTMTSTDGSQQAEIVCFSCICSSLWKIGFECQLCLETVIRCQWRTTRISIRCGIRCGTIYNFDSPSRCRHWTTSKADTLPTSCKYLINILGITQTTHKHTCRMRCVYIAANAAGNSAVNTYYTVLWLVWHA